MRQAKFYKYRFVAFLWLIAASLAFATNGIRAQEETRPPELHQNPSLEIFRKLQQMTELAVTRVTIRELPEWLSKTLHCDCELDEYELTQTGVSLELEVELSAKSRSLASALSQALTPIGLGWTIKNQTLVITNEDAVSATQVTLPYDISDLVTIPESLLAFSKFEAGKGESLINEMERQVASSDWESVGCPGIASTRRERNKFLLLVSQSWPNHILIDEFFQQQRELVDRTERSVFDRSFLQVYPLKTSEDHEAIVDAIQQFIVDKEDLKIELRIVRQGLILKGTWEIQLRVREFLVGIGELDDPADSYFFGSPGFPELGGPPEDWEPPPELSDELQSDQSDNK